jgi:hypothetical protein
MHVQVNTDGAGDHATLAIEAETALNSSLARFGERITRVEVHLSDENAHKSGVADKRCLMEARIAGRAPLAVSNNATAFGPAIHGAVEKLERALDKALGRASHS